MTWLVEDPAHPTADRMAGCGSVAHVLLRFALEPVGLGPPLLLGDPAAAPGGRSMWPCPS